MAKQIVVTGAAGFIGRNAVADLNAHGHDDLILVDELGTTDKWKNLRGLTYDDLISPADFLTLVQSGKLADVEAIVHLGACSATTERDADFLLRNNYQYTRTLCEWSFRHKARFIYASSAATYGEGAQGYSDADSATPTLRPLNMYGYSKHMFDLWALKHKLFDRIVGLKYFNVFGPRESHKQGMRSVINKAYAEVVTTGRMRLFRSHLAEYADGEQRRDFIYVDDAVAQTLFYFDHPDVAGLFNCGTGRARSWNELARALFAAVGRPPQIEYVDMPPDIRDKYQYFTQAGMDRVRLSGYDRSCVRLEEAVADYVKRELRFTVEQPTSAVTARS